MDKEQLKLQKQEYARNYHEKNKENIKIKQRKYYLKNKEKFSIRNKKNYQKNIEQRNEYRKNYKEEQKIINKNWREDNKEKIKEDRQKNKEKKNAYYKQHSNLTKKQAFLHYSNGVIQCACCGELEEDFLTLDHIDGRKKWNHNKSFVGGKLYAWLVKNNYPDGFQVLCYNCNCAKGKLGICPHQNKKSLEIRGKFADIGKI